MILLERTGFLAQGHLTVCARKHSCIAIRVVSVFSVDCLKIIVLLFVDKDYNSLTPDATTFFFPPVVMSYYFANPRVLTLIAVCRYKLLLSVLLHLVFPSGMWLSPSLCVTCQGTCATPPHGPS